MTAALCLHCGNIKHGAYLNCTTCEAPAFKETELNLAFTDHYLAASTLEAFGRVITHIRGIAPDEESALMSFLQLVSERHPEILYNITTADLTNKAGAVLHLGNIPEIQVVDSPRAVREANDLIQRLAHSRIFHRELRCKDCGHQQSFACWQRLNANTTPLGQALLILGRLFDFCCRQCGHVQSICYESLYINNNIAIWLKPNDRDVEQPDAEIPESSFLMQLNKDFLLRVVATPEEMIEKSRIYEDGWEDEAIELQKLRLCTAYNIDISTPPLYQQTNTNPLGQREIVFNGRTPISCQEKYLREEIEPVLSMLRKGGHLVEGDWQVRSVGTMMQKLVDAGMAIPVDSPSGRHT